MKKELEFESEEYAKFASEEYAKFASEEYRFPPTWRLTPGVEGVRYAQPSGRVSFGAAGFSFIWFGWVFQARTMRFALREPGFKSRVRMP